MKARPLLQAALFCLTMVTLSNGVLAQEKARIVVLPFDGRTVLTEIHRACKCSPSAQPDLGNAVADKMINRLAGGDTYTVVEREILESLMREHKLNQAGLIDDQTAVQLGKWAQAGVILTGSITPLIKFKKVLTYYSSADVEVILEARLVSVRDATVIAPINARSTKINGKYPTGDGILDMVIKATDDAVGKLAAGLVEAGMSPAVKATIMKGAPPVPVGAKLATCGKVAYVDDERQLMIKNSQGAVMKAGQTVRLRRRREPIPDPDAPSKILDYKYMEIGSISITEVGDKTSAGVFTGNAKPEVGDEVFCPMMSAPNASPYTSLSKPPMPTQFAEARAAANGVNSNFRSYTFSNVFTLDLPGNWVEAPWKDGVWLFPSGAKLNGGGVSQGIVAGVRRANGKELRGEASDYIAEVMGDKNHLKSEGDFVETNLGGQRFLARSYAGARPKTGKSESVTFHTTLMNDGRLLYFMTISSRGVPETDSDAQKIIQSLRFN